MTKYKLYKLTETVRNPHPDRRVKDDWRTEPEAKAGQYFVLAEDGDSPYALCRLRSWGHQGLPVDRGFARQIVPNLVEVREDSENPKDIRALVDFEVRGRQPEKNGCAHDILHVLVRDGKVGLSDIAAAYQVYMTQLEEDFEASYPPVASLEA